MTKYFYSALLSIFIGCTFLKQSKGVNKPCKEELGEHLKSVWFYYPEKNVYGEGKGMLNVGGTEWRECLLRMDRNDLVQLFGEPTVQTESKMYYFYGIDQYELYQQGRLSGVFMLIKLDVNGMYSAMNFPVISN
jgi:hypothetical protein